MKSLLISYAVAFRDKKHMLDTLKAAEFDQERKTAAIIRLVHSIEKGLSLESPRLGFGMEKLKRLFALCSAYAEKYAIDDFCLKMARDAIDEYIGYHCSRGYESAEFAQVCAMFQEFPCKKSPDEERYGGTLRIRNEYALGIEELETFFSQRHSIRDFAPGDVTEAEIMRAVRAAQYAPSACNRQAVRAYVLPASRVCELYASDLAGIGGFAEQANKFILITGKLSSYDKGEYQQHIVSASIFAAYLIEALFAQSIGACMVQRPLYYSSKWQDIAGKLGVSNDEQLVLMIAIGRMKEEYTVPLSKRFPTEQIVKFIDKA